MQFIKLLKFTFSTSKPKFTFNQQDLKNRLSNLQYYVTQEKGTERAFTGEYYKHKEDGIYGCIVCETPLFK
jgi:peptide-methionine (R)-S-oxide reductase